MKATNYNIVLSGTLFFVFLTHVLTPTGIKGFFAHIISFGLLSYVTFRTFQERNNAEGRSLSWKLISLRYLLCLLLLLLTLYILYASIF